MEAEGSVVGIVDREADGLPMADRRTLRTPDVAVDPAGIVSDGLHGPGKPTTGPARSPAESPALPLRPPDRVAPRPHRPFVFGPGEFRAVPFFAEFEANDPRDQRRRPGSVDLWPEPGLRRTIGTRFAAT